MRGREYNNHVHLSAGFCQVPTVSSVLSILVLVSRQRMTIAQAFADDDVIAEFREEKRALEERDKPKDIDLSLPGWGEWTGGDSKPSKRRRNR